jgi:hypothetical protein
MRKQTKQKWHSSLLWKPHKKDQALNWTARDSALLKEWERDHSEF